MKSEGFAERQRSKYAFSYLVLSRLFSSLKKAVFYLCKIGDKSSKAKDFYFLLLCYWFFSLNRFVINESNSPFILAFKIKSSILKQKGKLGGYLSSQWMLLPFVIFKAILNELENQDLYEWMRHLEGRKAVEDLEQGTSFKFMLTFEQLQLNLYF